MSPENPHPVSHQKKINIAFIVVVVILGFICWDSCHKANKYERQSIKEQKKIEKVAKKKADSLRKTIDNRNYEIYTLLEEVTLLEDSITKESSRRKKEINVKYEKRIRTSRDTSVTGLQHILSGQFPQD